MERTKLMALNDLAQEIHDRARSKGFYDRETLDTDEASEGIVPSNPVVNPSMPSEKVALMHEECSELLRALREGDGRGEALECADIIIRVLDFCAWRGIDIDSAIAEKMKTNMDRPYLHGHQF